ncbi:MAG: hypothetical protein L0210_05510 [Rhodospirillales bacterium]|nr:hypothetical protein [Rhodospirillales bacterium]
MPLKRTLRAPLPCLLACSAFLACIPAIGAKSADFDPEHPYVVKEDGLVDWYTYSG